MKQRQLLANLRETSLKLKNGNTVRVQFNPNKVFPADPDSTLAILNALEEYIRPGMRVLDIGTGSGIIGIAAAKLGAGYVLATDISSAALVCAKENAERNKVSIHLAKGSLFQPIKRENPFDIICFNPPFLPGTSGCEKPFGWKCGPEGLAFINAAIDKGYRFLQKNGTLLLTAFSTHDLSAIERRAMKRYQVKIEIAHKGKLFNLLPVLWEKPLLTKLEKKERLLSRRGKTLKIGSLKAGSVPYFRVYQIILNSKKKGGLGELGNI